MVFPPAGAAASYRAGKRKDTQRIVNAIQGLPPNLSKRQTKRLMKRMK